MHTVNFNYQFAGSLNLRCQALLRETKAGLNVEHLYVETYDSHPVSIDTVAILNEAGNWANLSDLIAEEALRRATN